MQNNWDFMDSTINDDVKNKSCDFFWDTLGGFIIMPRLKYCAFVK